MSSKMEVTNLNPPLTSNNISFTWKGKPDQKINIRTIGHQKYQSMSLAENDTTICLRVLSSFNFLLETVTKDNYDFFANKKIFLINSNKQALVEIAYTRYTWSGNIKITTPGSEIIPMLTGDSYLALADTTTKTAWVSDKKIKIVLLKSDNVMVNPNLPFLDVKDLKQQMCTLKNSKNPDNSLDIIIAPYATGLKSLDTFPPLMERCRRFMIAIDAKADLSQTKLQLKDAGGKIVEPDQEKLFSEKGIPIIDFYLPDLPTFEQTLIIQIGDVEYQMPIIAFKPTVLTRQLQKYKQQQDETPKPPQSPSSERSPQIMMEFLQKIHPAPSSSTPPSSPLTSSSTPVLAFNEFITSMQELGKKESLKRKNEDNN